MGLAADALIAFRDGDKGEMGRLGATLLAEGLEMLRATGIGLHRAFSARR